MGCTVTAHVHTVTYAADPARRKQLDQRAQLLAAASVSYNLIEAVIAITAGVVAGSIALVGGHEPDASPVGMVLAAVSLAVMPFRSWAQRRTGKQLGSNAAVADSTQTLLCTYLSAVLLLGLVLNAALGWSWADPLAGLVIAAVVVREGLEAWRGEGCACGAAPGAAGDLAIIAEPSCTDGCCDHDGGGLTVARGGLGDSRSRGKASAAPQGTPLATRRRPLDGPLI